MKNLFFSIYVLCINQYSLYFVFRKENSMQEGKHKFMFTIKNQFLLIFCWLCPFIEQKAA